MAVKFNQPVKHDRLQFFPDVAIAFEDANADAYFINAGWAESTDDAPVHTYSAEEVVIDVETVHGDGPNRGLPVMEG